MPKEFRFDTDREYQDEIAMCVRRYHLERDPVKKETRKKEGLGTIDEYWHFLGSKRARIRDPQDEFPDAGTPHYNMVVILGGIKEAFTLEARDILGEDFLRDTSQNVMANKGAKG